MDNKSYARDTADGFRDQMSGIERDTTRSKHYQRGYSVAEQKAQIASGLDWLCK